MEGDYIVISMCDGIASGASSWSGQLAPNLLMTLDVAQ